MQRIKIKEMVKYNGHSVKANGSVDLNFKAMYSEITNSMQLLQLLNNDVSIAAKKEGKVYKLGVFRIKNVKFDGDGESFLYFNSISDSVEMNNINSIISADEFNILMVADVELEEEGDESE